MTREKKVMQMRDKKRRYELDMTHGAMFTKLIRFTIPLALTSVLQLLYNAADVIVVGRFTGPEALAAVGSTGALINLIVNLFLGLSVGTNVIASRSFGAGDAEKAGKVVHTSVTVSLIGGLALGVFGFIFGKTFLVWMGSPKEVLPHAAIYVKIFFLGMPFNMLYNFGAAIMRAVGDTERPLKYLMISGIVNVILNLILVAVFKMGIAGVAWATITSQLLSAIMVVKALTRSEGYMHLDLHALKISPPELKEMMHIGLPAGMQGVCFSLSNVIIQSTVNGYGATIVAGNAASQNLEGFMYVSMNAVHQAAVTFVSANMGAGEHRRMRSAMLQSIALVTMIGVGTGIVFYVFKSYLLGMYTNDTAVIAEGARRLTVFTTTYSLCGIMDVLCGVMRGTGSSVIPMVISLVGACVMRILWVMFVLPLFEDPSIRLMMLYYSYPISWILTGGTHLISCVFKLKQFPVQQSLKEVLE